MGDLTVNKKSVSCVLSCDMSLSGSLSSEGGLSGTLSKESGLTGKLGLPGYAVYAGDYNIIPKAFKTQVLETENKIMTNNVTVNEVPYFETSNDSGTTVYIAKELEIYGED